MIHELYAIAAAQGGVLTAAQAAECGLSRDELRARLREKQFVQIRRKVYAPTELVADADARATHRIAVAAALVTRGWSGKFGPPSPLAAGHHSAAVLWDLPIPGRSSGLWTPGTSDGPPESAIELVSGDRGRRTYRADVWVQPATLPAEHVVLLDGIPVTSLARTAVDLMRDCPRSVGLIAADAALRAGCPREELRAVARFCARWRGGRKAVELAELADPRAESPAESLARLVVLDRGFPTPHLQYEIRDRDGRRRFLDIAFPEFWTDLEVDGRTKYTDARVDPATTYWQEKLREDAVRDVEWEVVRATWHQLTKEPDSVAARLRAAFARACRLRGEPVPPICQPAGVPVGPPAG